MYLKHAITAVKIFLTSNCSGPIMYVRAAAVIVKIVEDAVIFFIDPDGILVLIIQQVIQEHMLPLLC